MKKKLLLYGSLTFLILLIFPLLIMGFLLLEYTIEKSAQQQFVNQIKRLGNQDIAGLEIMMLSPLNIEQQEKGEKKMLSRDEITLVQDFLKDPDADSRSFFRYLSQRISQYYQKLFRGDTTTTHSLDEPGGSVYSCLLTIHIENDEMLEFLGSIYENYKDYEHDLFLLELNAEKVRTTRTPKPVRIKNLGKWILENITSTETVEAAETTEVVETVEPVKVAEPVKTVEPVEAAEVVPSDQTHTKLSKSPISDFPQDRLSGNFIANGDFTTLEEWEQFHSSEGQDVTNLTKGNDHIIWERTNSQNTSGSMGVYQNLDRDVRYMNALSVCLDVRVDYHTLENPGWWSEKHRGSSDMPVQIAVLYLDEKGRSHRWNHGFLIYDNARTLLWLNPNTGKWEYRRGVTPLQNVTPVPKASWCHFCFDLLDDEIRKDMKGQNTLPKPVKLIRLLLHGNGWDFKGAVGNVVLKGERIPLAESTYTSVRPGRESVRKRSSFTFTTHLMQKVPKSHTFRFQKNHRMVITTSGGASMKVLDPQKHPLPPISATARQLEVLIPWTDYYTVVFRGREGGLLVRIDSLPQR